jgi:hypothetical protein
MMVTSTAIAPFFWEDLSGDTQLAFPVMYTLLDRMAKAGLVLAKTFAGGRFWHVYLSCALIAVTLDFAVVYRWKDGPSPLGSVNTVKMAIDVATAWAACCSFVAGSLPSPRESFGPFTVMVTGWVLIVLRSAGAFATLGRLLRASATEVRRLSVRENVPEPDSAALELAP